MVASKLLSIAVCTFNRGQQLKPLLQQFKTLGDSLVGRAELLLIDNNSNDDTQAIAAAFSMPFEYRILREGQQGLANARNCALANFSGDAILFFDDDVSITQQSLDTYLDVLEKGLGGDFFGGPIRVDWQGPAPKWLKSDDLSLLAGLFGQYEPAKENADYDGSIFDPYGANFMLMRNTVDQVGLFNPKLGVSGDEIGRGEETEYFVRARQMGLRGQYLAAAGIGHRFQKERVTIPYLYRYGLEKGRAQVRSSSNELQPNSGSWVFSSCGFVLKGVWQLLKGRRDRMYQCVINIGILRGVSMSSRRLAGE